MAGSVIGSPRIDHTGSPQDTPSKSRLTGQEPQLARLGSFFGRLRYLTTVSALSLGFVILAATAAAFPLTSVRFLSGNWPAMIGSIQGTKKAAACVGLSLHLSSRVFRGAPRPVVPVFRLR